VKCKLCSSIEAEDLRLPERYNDGVEQINREKRLQWGAPRCTMPLTKRRELIISPRGLRQRGADAVEYGTPAKMETRDEERNDVGPLRDRWVRDCARFHADVAARARMADEVDVHRVRSPNAPTERKVRAFRVPGDSRGATGAITFRAPFVPSAREARAAAKTFAVQR